MADIVTDATPKTAGFASRGSNYSAKQARIEKEEKEIEELMKAQGGTPVEEEVEAEEAPVEAKEVETTEEAEAEDEKLSGEEKSFKKRYGDLRRHMSAKEKEWEARFEALESNTSSNVRPPKSDEDIEDWARQYPDVAAIVESIAEKNSDDPRSVIRVLDLYKVDKGMTPSDKKAQAKDAAKTVSKRTRTPVDATGSESMIKESAVAKMSDKQFEANYDAISEAMQSGKFIYDISGKAR